MKTETKIVLGLAAGFAAFGFLKSKLITPDIIEPHQLGEKMLHSCVWAPIKEEIVYRHIGNRTYSELLGDKTAGSMASSALFAYGHRQPKASLERSAFHVIDAFMGALVYTYAHEIGGLPASIAVHAAHNAGVNIGGLRRRSS